MTQEIGGESTNVSHLASSRPEVLPPLSTNESPGPTTLGGRVRNIGWSFVPFLAFAGFLALIVFFFKGALWASQFVLPWLMLIAMVAIAIDILVLLPMSLFHPLRSFTGGMLQLSSLLLGLTTWLTGFVLTLALWGGFAVALGLFMFGVGVVPMAVLATLFKGMWSELITLMIMVVMTFGARIVGLAISGAADRKTNSATMAFNLARVIAACLLFGALSDLPYDYYTLLRWVVCSVAAYGAVLAKQQGTSAWLWTFGIMAVFFNPIAPVQLTRETWAPIDVAAGITMLVSLRSFREASVNRNVNNA